MSRSINPRFKCLINLRQNIWNTSKPLKFKKQKWRVIKRFLLNRRYTHFRKKKFFFKRLNMRNFYKLRLNIRKIFFSMYGKLNNKKFVNLINKFSHKGNLLKSRNYLFNNLVIGNYKFDNLLYLIQMFESKFIVSLFRMGIFNTIYAAVHFIKLGGVLINGKIIKNPFYNLKEGDLIYLNKNFFYNILSFNKKFKINTYKKRFLYFKRFPGIFNYKAKNVIYFYKKFKYIYSYKPYVSDLDVQKKIPWDLIVYLMKLKRL